MPQGKTILGRQCASCTLCCKVMEIGEFNKQKGKWCSKCDIGKRCKIYDKRPNECRTFYCGYLISPNLGDHWRPDDCHMVVTGDSGGKRIVVRVDADEPNSWKIEPYYSELKQWSALAARSGTQLVVFTNSNAVVVFPDRDVDLGDIEHDDRIFTAVQQTADGPRTEVLKLKADDPRITGL